MAANHPSQSPPKSGWMASSLLQKGFEDMNRHAGPNRKVPRIPAKPTPTTAPAPPRAAGSLSPLPQRARSHPPRAVRYILLDSCRNIPASYILASVDSHKAHRGKPTQGSGRSPDARKRLPVFLQLCGEDVPISSPRDARLQTSSHERKVQPNAKALREGKRGQRMKKKMAGCTPSDKA
ncbi:uncharacterized protein LOC109370628 isoform X2 [Meleagris gallopavo]|uniref:uncharacterized protein LOC109370628 isoform X2 n=1 Tax=Meleagris gallopavo TaxID=9103 RepID=UPI00093F7EB5|nr:uncharacterized protein LOC109370628 isoform X2 [Meleagris gallopavo]